MQLLQLLYNRDGHFIFSIQYPRFIYMRLACISCFIVSLGLVKFFKTSKSDDVSVRGFVLYVDATETKNSLNALAIVVGSWMTLPFSSDFRNLRLFH